MKSDAANSDSERDQDGKCLNCAAVLVGRYCHACGQDNSRGRLFTSELVSGFLGSLLALDSRYVRTFWGLIRTPGVVCRDYVAGKRRSYSNPVAYFVAALTLDLLMAATVSFLSHGGAAGAPIDISSSVAAPIGLIISLPMAAFCTWLFRDAGYNLAENYVFTLYLVGQLLLYEMLLTPMPQPNVSDEWIGLLVIAVLAAMFVQSGSTFYGLKKRVVLCRLAVVIMVMLVVVVVVELLFPGLIDQGHV